MTQALETQNKTEIPAWKEVINGVNDLTSEEKVKTGNIVESKREDIKDSYESKRMLNNFQQKDLVNNIKDPTKQGIIKNALDKPEKEEVSKMQQMLWYNKDGDFYYNPIRTDIRQKNEKWETIVKENDGKAWPFTIGAINNLIADDMEKWILEKRIIPWATKEVNDFIGTLHPYFYNRFKEKNKLADITDPKEKENAGTVMDIMIKIKEGKSNKEDIQKMQIAMNDLKVYPVTHRKEQKDGIPGPYTQVALQNYVFKYLQKSAQIV